jgi:hypothetical protein
MFLFKKKELELTVREWLPLAEAGSYGESIAKLMARLNKFISVPGGLFCDVIELGGGGDKATMDGMSFI